MAVHLLQITDPVLCCLFGLLLMAGAPAKLMHHVTLQCFDDANIVYHAAAAACSLSALHVA